MSIEKSDGALTSIADHTWTVLLARVMMIAGIPLLGLLVNRGLAQSDDLTALVREQKISLKLIQQQSTHTLEMLKDHEIRLRDVERKSHAHSGSVFQQ
jgi:hypothetical protein